MRIPKGWLCAGAEAFGERLVAAYRSGICPW